ncbi:uncharacterized protein JCM6883_005827 [Sporobolomyces salmoneus]|uniref:uncharacterized protein n=1 Tax=Sporobolomyces salmoneus TaxID=183962 RepID=UPI00317E7975
MPLNLTGRNVKGLFASKKPQVELTDEVKADVARRINEFSKHFGHTQLPPSDDVYRKEDYDELKNKFLEYKVDLKQTIFTQEEGEPLQVKTPGVTVNMRMSKYFFNVPRLFLFSKRRLGEDASQWANYAAPRLMGLWVGTYKSDKPLNEAAYECKWNPTFEQCKRNNWQISKSFLPVLEQLRSDALFINVMLEVETTGDIWVPIDIAKFGGKECPLDTFYRWEVRGSKGRIPEVLHVTFTLDPEVNPFHAGSRASSRRFTPPSSPAN